MPHNNAFFSVLFCLALSIFGTDALAQPEWTILNSDNNHVTLRDIHARGDTIIAVGPDIGTYTSHIFTSVDAGQTWDTTQLSTGPLLRSITFIDNQVGIITSVNTNSCILRTTDGGMSWEWGYCDTDSMFQGVNQVQFITDQIGYMAGWGAQSFFSGSLYKTTDAGINWEHIGGSRPGQPFEYAQWLDEQNGYAGAFLFGNLDLHRTNDGGQTWTTLGGDSLGFSSAYWRSVAEGYVVGATGTDGTIYHTLDSGNTWTMQTSFPGVFLNSITFANENDGVAVGNTSGFPLSSHIVRTSDGGATWHDDNDVFVSGTLEKVRYFNGRFLAVGGEGYVLAYDLHPLAISDGGLETASALTLYPNPAKDRVTVKSAAQLTGTYEAEILDVLGQRVLLTSFMGEATASIELDRNRLLPGMYWVRVSQQGKMAGMARLVLE